MAVSGTVFSFFHAISHGLLEECFNLSYIKIYHDVSFQTKWALFEILINERTATMFIENKEPNLFATHVQEIFAKNYATLIKAMKKESVPDFAMKPAASIQGSVQSLSFLFSFLIPLGSNSFTKTNSYV